MVTLAGLDQYKTAGYSTICLGIFDGMHRGHREVMAGADAVVTCDPHPQTVLQQTPVERLTLVSEQALFGPHVVVIPFNEQVANLDPRTFLDAIIGSQLAPKQITVGYDFRFGKHAAGTVETLRDWGQANDCRVIVVPPVYDADRPIKSRDIRIYIKTDPNRAIELLGHPYPLMGTVVLGEQRGRTWGFPTANMRLDPHKCLPRWGVYAGWVPLDQKRLRAIIYIGRKPSFDGQFPQPEVHILDGFSGDLYGTLLTVYLERFIRDEQYFSSQSDLRRQIQADIDNCLLL
jgi:riboflavin kinase/FMN adenylyltransferase